MKYVKADIPEPIESLELAKIHLVDDEGFAESPWTRRTPDGKRQILVNNALLFMPLCSWGLVLPTGADSMNVEDFLCQESYEMHPEAWDHYLAEGIIDSDGQVLRGVQFK